VKARQSGRANLRDARHPKPSADGRRPSEQSGNEDGQYDEALAVHESPHEEKRRHEERGQTTERFDKKELMEAVFVRDYAPLIERAMAIGTPAAIAARSRRRS